MPKDCATGKSAGTSTSCAAPGSMNMPAIRNTRLTMSRNISGPASIAFMKASTASGTRAMVMK
jgi:hypothetical protein